MGFLIIISEQLKALSVRNQWGTSSERYRKAQSHFAVTHVCWALIHCSKLHEPEICVGETVF